MATSGAAPAHVARRRTAAPLLRAGQARLLIRLAAILAGAIAVKSFVVDPLTGHFGGTFEDFSAYMGAARSMAAGGSPYAQFSSATPVMSGFTYPPFAGVLVRPLALLTNQQALSVWLALSLATTVIAAVIVARTALPASWPRLELAVIASVAFGPAAYNYWHGQINGVIFLLLATGYWAYVTGRGRTAGIVLGLAAGIKVAPVVLIVLLLRRRWWQGAAAMAATVAATVGIGVLALGTGPTHTFIAGVLPALSRPMGWVYNQSLTAAVSRVFEHSVLAVQTTPPAIAAAGWALTALVLGIAGWAVRPGARQRPERGAEFGLGVLAMLLAGSLAWYAHYTALLIPLAGAVALARDRDGDDRRALLAATAGAVVVFAVVAPLAIAALTMPGLVALSASPAWWPVLQLFSLPCVAALWLMVRLYQSLSGAGRGVARPLSRKGYQAS